MNYIILTLIVTMFIICGYFVFEMWRNRHTLVLRKVINNKKTILKTKFRIYKDAEGTEYFKLFPSKRELIPAPAQAIDVSKWGSMWVEAYEHENGSVTYIHDSHNDGKGLQPLTTSQRRLLIGEIEKAKSRKKLKWTEHLPTIFAISGFAIIIICLFIFWGDMAQPLLDMGDRINANQQIQTEQLQILQEIKLGIQRIEGTSPSGVPD